MGGMEELIQIAQDVIVPRFDRTEDDAIDWIAIARRECEVGCRIEVKALSKPAGGSLVAPDHIHTESLITRYYSTCTHTQRWKA